MVQQRRAAKLLAGCLFTLLTLVVTSSCLFPSFNDLEQTNATTRSDAGKDAVTTDTSPAETDAGAVQEDDAAGRFEIQCDTAICALPAQYCCWTAAGLQCRGTDDFGGIGTCKIQNIGFGKSYTCDGEEDCLPGQTCCFNNTDENGVNAKCRPTCDSPSQSLCNGPLHKCPDGKKCTGKLSGGIQSCE